MLCAGASAEMQSADPLPGQDGLLLRIMIAAPVLSGAIELNDFIASLPLQLNTIFTNEGGPIGRECPSPTVVLESDATHVAPDCSLVLSASAVLNSGATCRAEAPFAVMAAQSVACLAVS